MKILDYYLSKQNDPVWLAKFQSISKDNCGKNFSYYNTNFRNILSFEAQILAFLPAVGKQRSQWSKSTKTGQEADKQRVVNLQNAMLIEKKIIDPTDSKKDVFVLTDKGNELIRLLKNTNVSSENRDTLWFLIFLMLLDYRTNENELEIEKTSIKIFHNLESVNININSFLKMLIELIRSSKDKETLFKNPLFWLITFNEDKEFLELFVNASSDDKEDLYNWVIACSKSKDSRDLIAHKFVSSGVYSCGSFVDDAFVILLTMIGLAVLNPNFYEYVSFACRVLNSAGKNINTSFVIKTINSNDCYLKSYKNSIVKIINKI